MKTSQLAALCFTCLLGILPCTATAQPFVVSADGNEVTDQNTGLIWRRCAEGMAVSGGTCTGTATSFTYEAALARAKEVASPAVAWRLPDIKELSSIVDSNRSIPAIDLTAFPATPTNGFWSSSPHVGNPANAWYVVFSIGNVNANDRAFSNQVRLVRAGQ